MQKSVLLIVGLGNPGKVYRRTRHNIGFSAIEKLAEKYEMEPFQKQKRCKGLLAKGAIGIHSVLLFMPQTYMNLSGQAVACILCAFKIELSCLLILVDDVALPLGQLRIRTNSSSGGHNGLKSIEEYLRTNGYARLKIGVGDQGTEDLAEYVLAKFSEEEQKLIPNVLERVIQSIEIWLDRGLTSAMNYANSSSTPSIGE